MAMHTTGSQRTGKIWIALGITGLLTGWYFGYLPGSNRGMLAGTTASAAKGGAGSDADKLRAAQYISAVGAGAVQTGTWPATPETLISEFWKAVAADKMQQVLLYCPGSTAQDFQPYTSLKPTPNAVVGKAQQHPVAKDVSVYPVNVSFPGSVPKKTIKLAVARLPDSRLIIDGRNSIWW